MARKFSRAEHLDVGDKVLLHGNQYLLTEVVLGETQVALITTGKGQEEFYVYPIDTEILVLERADPSDTARDDRLMIDRVDQQPPRYPADQSTVGTMTDPTTPPPR